MQQKDKICFFNQEPFCVLTNVFEGFQSTCKCARLLGLSFQVQILICTFEYAMQCKLESTSETKVSYVEDKAQTSSLLQASIPAVITIINLN